MDIEADAPGHRLHNTPRNAAMHFAVRPQSRRIAQRRWRLACTGLTPAALFQRQSGVDAICFDVTESQFTTLEPQLGEFDVRLPARQLIDTEIDRGSVV